LRGEKKKPSKGKRRTKIPPEGPEHGASEKKGKSGKLHATPGKTDEKKRGGGKETRGGELLRGIISPSAEEKGKPFLIWEKPKKQRTGVAQNRREKGTVRRREVSEKGGGEET